jgi:hypothetical protein
MRQPLCFKNVVDEMADRDPLSHAVGPNLFLRLAAARGKKGKQSQGTKGG